MKPERTKEYRDLVVQQAQVGLAWIKGSALERRPASPLGEQSPWKETSEPPPDWMSWRWRIKNTGRNKQ